MILKNISILLVTTALALVFISAANAAPDKDVNVINDNNNPVPVEVLDEIVTMQRLPVSESGEWQGAGMNIPSMIVHDMVFYNSNYSLCKFSVSYVTGQFTSRQLYYVEIELNESADFHFEAGIDSANLRFGTITPVGGDPNACIIHWAAMGYAIE